MLGMMCRTHRRTLVQDVKSDGGIIKKTLKETTDWNKPNAESKVVLRYTARLQDGTVFEERGEGNELRYAADEGALAAPLLGTDADHDLCTLACAHMSMHGILVTQTCACFWQPLSPAGFLSRTAVDPMCISEVASAAGLA